MHPDVRELLWLRASGATQLRETYRGYHTNVESTDQKDYYTVLKESPCPPNPSVGAIKVDQKRIYFDLNVTA